MTNRFLPTPWAFPDGTRGIWTRCHLEAAVTRGTAQLEVAIVAEEPLYPGYIQRTARRTGLADLFGATSWIGRWVRYETTFLSDYRLGLRGLSTGQVELGVYPGYELWVSRAYRCPAL